MSAVLFVLAALDSTANAQPREAPVDSARTTAARTEVRAQDTTQRIIIRNIDIAHYPVMSVAFDLLDSANRPIDGLRREDISIFENDTAVTLLSLTKITNQNRIPIDFIFALDVTGSMRGKIAGIKAGIENFCTKLTSSGISYRLGLVTFGDVVIERREPTDNVAEFLSWVRATQAAGGGDMPENALEALSAATHLNFRPSANRCVILISDMPYHQDGEHGDGQTQYTTNTITDVLNRSELQTFCVAPDDIPGYRFIATATGGRWFDIRRPFTGILDSFAVVMTPHYVATYRSPAYIMPDSVVVEVRATDGMPSQRRRIAVAEVGRRLLLNDILFATNSSQIVPDAHPELDYIAELLRARRLMKLGIEGHTDNVGTDVFNQQLSERRAESVKGYLLRKGIDADRLQTIGFGMKRPVAPNATEDGRRLNRRIEFVILAK